VDPNPHAFVGGLVNGGFTDEAMREISKVLRFDYMRSAGFEWGAVAKTFKRIVERREEYTRDMLTLHKSNIKLDSLDSRRYEVKKNVHNIFIFCHRHHNAEVKKRISMMAWGDSLPLDQKTHLPRSLADCKKPNHGKLFDIVGWMELENGFFFFSEEEMWNRVCGDLFGIWK
jgi:hypothetical protein